VVAPDEAAAAVFQREQGSEEAAAAEFQEQGRDQQQQQARFVPLPVALDRSAAEALEREADEDGARSPAPKKISFAFQKP